MAVFSAQRHKKLGVDSIPLQSQNKMQKRKCGKKINAVTWGSCHHNNLCSDPGSQTPTLRGVLAFVAY